jgi:phosphoglycolate phosphatase-like HAD superfamily hydrolase
MKMDRNLRITPSAMIFDMDGTLFQTETLVIPAYEKAFERLREEGLYEGDMPPPGIILGSLGMLLEDIWKRVLPDANEQARARMDTLLLEEQLTMLQAEVGKLYPGVAETLAVLRERGIRLFVASNGLEAYVKGVAEHLGISSLFDGLYSAGEYQTQSKVQLVRLLLDHHGVESAWMVGDRSSDVEAGKENGLFVVGCDYAAFGVSTAEELQGADVRIEAFGELLQHIS